MIAYEKHHSSSIDYIYRQYDNNLEFGSHFHNSFEFIYVFEGEIIVSIEKEKYKLKEKQGLLILPNQIHSYQTSGESKTFILIFASSFVAKYYKQSLAYYSNKPFFYLEDNEKTMEILQNGDNPFLLKSVLYYLVYEYTKGEQLPRDEKYNTLMQHVLTYIESNYQKDITLKTLAKSLGYDYHYLSTIINNGLHANFSSFLNEYRINKVCELMMDDSQAQISDLADSCGYTSLRTFNRNFVEYKKMTPRQYRQNLVPKNEGQ